MQNIEYLKLVPLPDDQPIDISRDQMTLLMMEAYKRSSTATEELMCLREVAKMNGLYEKQITTSVNIHLMEKNTQKLQALSDEDLLKLSGSNSNMFNKPVNQAKIKDARRKEEKEEKILDAEFTEIAEETAEE